MDNDLISLIQAAAPNAKAVALSLLGARAVLFVFDSLDETFPRLRKVTKVLGTLLGGRKAR